MNPIDMILRCPRCGVQHIDEPDKPGPHFQSVIQGGGWDNPPHKSHLCAGCGYIWRPADVPTNGVAEIKTKGKNDSTAIDPNYPAAVMAVGEAMVNMTTTVRYMDEWPAIPTLWKDCMEERDRLRERIRLFRLALRTSHGMGVDNLNDHVAHDVKKFLNIKGFHELEGDER